MSPSLKRRVAVAFGGYGGAKGLGYLAGPIGGGALVVLGGYRLLFAGLTALAVAAAGWAAVAVAAVPPTKRPRETLAGLVRRLGQARFLQPVLVLAAATAAFSAGVGFLPVVGRRAGLGALATGAAVSLLAGCAAIVQPRIGRALDASRLDHRSAGGGLGLPVPSSAATS